MADRVSASIRIGGVITAVQYAHLAQLIAQEGLATDWDAEPFDPDQREVGTPLVLCAHEVAGGSFDAIEAWCVANGVPFSRQCDGYSGQWDPERVIFRGEGAVSSYTLSEDGRVMIDWQTCRQLATLDAVFAHFEAAEASVPPLEIAGLIPEPAIGRP